jgi:succinate-semialdehyde dehydrogenase / glutarate-semialdehyde dehydrogenase
MPAGPGWFYPPTVLTDIPEDCPAWGEELFGPVASLFRVRDIDEAIRLANDSASAWAAAWTNDADEQQRFIDEIDAGFVFINGMVASDPRLPFGGIKRSGYGRELGRVGIHEFVNMNVVVETVVAGLTHSRQSHQPCRYQRSRPASRNSQTSAPSLVTARKYSRA